MIVERLLFPCSKLATTRHWHDTTLAEELGVQDATENELDAAMDWLLERQKAMETKAGPAAPDQRRLGPLRRQQQLLRRGDVPRGPPWP